MTYTLPSSIDRRAERRQDLKLSPKFLARQIARLRAIERDDRSHRGADRVLDAVVCKNVAIGRHERRHIHAGSSEWEIPDDFSGARLQRPNAAIARAEDQLLQTADRQTRRRAERRVIGAGPVPLIQRNSPVALLKHMKR